VSRSARNKTLHLTAEELAALSAQLPELSGKISAAEAGNQVFHADLLEILDFLPRGFVDLMILDPPYNLDKDFHGLRFSRQSDQSYAAWLRLWFPRLLPLLKPGASLYFCGDWRNSADIYALLNQHLVLRNRICWQREKGRGAKRNWKNSCEDIWFATLDEAYHFDVEAVKSCRRVLAPYREEGQPKDWIASEKGNFRLTHPSNFWDDISVPYWSMPENTEHPTQKPEKLLARLILASSRPGDLVFDPFVGSGSTVVTAKKLDRRYCGIEINREYCCWALERLKRVENDRRIQGYEYGRFWERNTKPIQIN